MTSPKVSVCIPVYNGSPYIAEAVGSVLAQTYGNFELLICDNCSTDDTKDIVCTFKDQRIQYVRNTRNLGLVGNANRCLGLAKGEYICIFHHDDVMLPDNLERKIALLDENARVGLVHSNIMLIDTEGKIVSQNIWNKDSTRDYIEEGSAVFKKFLEYLPFGSSIFIGAVMARRSCYDRLGGFSPELIHCNDSEMWMRMMLHYDVACIADPLVKYRVHPISTSSSWGNYTSLPYLREHYHAARMIFDNYGENMLHANVLLRQVSLSFARRALRLSRNKFGHGDFAEGKAFLKESIHFSSKIIKELTFWITLTKFLIRPSGVRFCQAIKKHIGYTA
ncbi:MAG: glycosyltransferase [Nitrospirota bacterium]